MEWSKYTVEDKPFALTSLVAFLLLLGGLYSDSYIVFFIGVLYFVAFFVNNYYLKHVGEELKLVNKKVRSRHFIGEAGEWEIVLTNMGLPIMKGELQIVFDDCVSPINEKQSNHLSNYTIKMPFSINKGQSKIITIPYQAVKRGVSKITNIELKIPHFFGFGDTVLEYKQLFKNEALVYPSVMPVHNLKHFLSEKSGESIVNHSLFEDMLAPSGTRDYLYSDSFNRIHWKASARKQTLQTKVFETAAERGWHLSINIAERYAINNQLEFMMSSAAELAYYSYKNNIPFSISINMRVFGNTPFCYIPVGTGKEHLQRILETLSLVNHHSILYPYDKMVSFYERHLFVQPYFIQSGLVNETATDMIKSLNRKGVNLLRLDLDEKQAAIKRYHIDDKRGVS
ncbi:DUF58 domain-containing protein [Bacillus sp. 31A1R]|uniref:DUF58 domain-containing protein n=1 Tax=Robertmurraya mangrovi TaxID=3098077 RepID=A0ABU5ITV8_9BACI|nr:DUF58 domain-containing protein [Bacillus sp. 31A1R]MDZ5470569.1 DUF58 domain-containing protein [Bacillus sp. 31A1R]